MCLPIPHLTAPRVSHHSRDGHFQSGARRRFDRKNSVIGEARQADDLIVGNVQTRLVIRILG